MSTSKMSDMGTAVHDKNSATARKPWLMRVGVGLFAVGLVAVVAVFLLFAAGYSELAEALSFALNNTGNVDAEYAFVQAGPYTVLPTASSMHFEFVGARYEGRLFVRFPAPAGGEQLPGANPCVAVVKITHHC